MADNPLKFPEMIAQSDVSWYVEQLEKSGLTQELANHAGLVLKPGKYLIPYFDMTGNPTPVVRARIRESDSSSPYSKGDNRYMIVAGRGYGAIPYWPKHPAIGSHQEKLQDLDRSLWIVEGEKKALCLQAQLLAQGYDASVVGLGGHNHTKALFSDLEHIPMRVTVGKDTAHRQVVIALDFNAQEPTADRLVRLSERKIYDYLVDRGAEVLVLRWEAPGDQEQKIDDWLVAGGKLSDAIAFTRASPPGMAISAKDYEFDFNYFDANYAKFRGKIIAQADAATMTVRQFTDHYLHKFSVDHSGNTPKKIRHAALWLERTDTPIIDEVVFDPWPPNEPARERIVGTKLNTFGGWHSEPMEGDVEPWLTHLAHCIPTPEAQEWFHKWVGHMIQRPHETTSQYVVLVSEKHGTGKGLIARGLTTMLGKSLVGQGARENWLGRFNGEWAGKLLIVTDEVQTQTRREEKAMGERIKQVVGGGVALRLEDKGQRAVEVSNYLRLLFLGNRVDMTFVEENDRRAAYFDVATFLDPTVGAALGDWYRLPGTPAALLSWACRVDLSGWNPQAPALITEAKLESIEAALDDLHSFVSDIEDGVLLAGKDIWKAEEILMQYEMAYGKYHSGIVRFIRNLKRRGILRARRSNGADVNLHKVGGKAVRLWCVRNHADWVSKEGACWAENNLKNY